MGQPQTMNMANGGFRYMHPKSIRNPGVCQPPQGRSNNFCNPGIYSVGQLPFSAVTNRNLSGLHSTHGGNRSGQRRSCRTYAAEAWLDVTPDVEHSRRGADRSLRFGSSGFYQRCVHLPNFGK
jgi:hypothetical protein